MKNLLIISPHFPPVNAADMHRVRQSLPYFKEYGWNPTVVTVDPKYVETGKDPLLLRNIPQDVEVYLVKALSTKYTRKVGLGSLAWRSMFFYYIKVSRLLKERKFDLVYFSTTMFPIPVLGRLWKKKFGVPYVIDMQDPWHTDYYLSKPKAERPPKFWFSYTIGKHTEPYAMKKVDGIISVSDAYNTTLQERYNNITPEKCMTLTFGAFEKDFEVLDQNHIENRFFSPYDGLIHIPYIGRAGHDMKFSLTCIFNALKIGLAEKGQFFEEIRLYFIGTSYAAAGKGKKTVMPLAEKIGVQQQVMESTDRISFFEALKLLKDASMLVIPGSDDQKYTASKLYNYILARKKILAIFHKNSSVVEILGSLNAGSVVSFDDQANENIISQALFQRWCEILESDSESRTNWGLFYKFSASYMTKMQVEFFNNILAL